MGKKKMQEKIKLTLTLTQLLTNPKPTIDKAPKQKELNKVP